MDKRQRERARKLKQQEKQERRAARALEREKRATEGRREDDLDGVVPGPQPGQIIDLG
jgi:hypothetical protein